MTALVLGIVAIAGAWIPIVNVVSIVIAVIGIIFGIVALAVAGKRGGKGKGTGGTGLILSILAIAAAIIMNVVVFNAASDYVDGEYDSYMEDCTADGLLSEQECQDIWDDTVGLD
ncbi:MAG: hypothetical protein HOQ43_21260 [Glycomyces artemisiae]|uniref:DUF4190 domain-containing protein n=1 Tax=Glycomyces artemisiae TaxID=1076443 RepID=A0A850CFY3_9ACTN|nr:hypothetical protein [Glycomyces artemisiae]